MKADPSERYEAHAGPQRIAARDLLLFTGAVRPRTILEPGCGTGLYTRMLLGAFPGASVLAVDLSEARVTAARARIVSPEIRFETADAEDLPPASYDLISSNATFQWFRRLPQTLGRFARMLTEGGSLSFSFFGPGTYRELDEAMREAFGGETRVTASGFAGRDTLACALDAGFPRWAVEERVYTRVFPSVHDLLRSIKFTGTRGTPCGPPIRWTRGALSRIEKAYLGRWGCIRATYQVYLCKGEGAHPSATAGNAPARSAADRIRRPDGENPPRGASGTGARLRRWNERP